MLRTRLYRLLPRPICPVLLLVALFLTAGVGARRAVAGPTTVGYAVGNTAPDFTALNQFNNPVSLRQLKGKYVLLDFCAAWCGPCQSMAPSAAGVRETLRQAGIPFEYVTVLLQGTDFTTAVRADAERWGTGFRETGLVLHPAGDDASPLWQQFRSYSVPITGPGTGGAFPTLVFLDPAQRILRIDVGAQGAQTLLDAFAPGRGLTAPPPITPRPLPAAPKSIAAVDLTLTTAGADTTARLMLQDLTSPGATATPLYGTDLSAFAGFYSDRFYVLLSSAGDPLASGAPLTVKVQPLDATGKALPEYVPSATANVYLLGPFIDPAHPEYGVSPFNAFTLDVSPSAAGGFSIGPATPDQAGYITVQYELESLWWLGENPNDYLVGIQIEHTVARIQGYGLKAARTAKLVGDLWSALSAMDSTQRSKSTAAALLDAFLTDVQTARGRDLTGVQADDLTSRGSFLKSLLVSP